MSGGASTLLPVLRPPVHVEGQTAQTHLLKCRFARPIWYPQGLGASLELPRGRGSPPPDASSSSVTRGAVCSLLAEVIND